MISLSHLKSFKFPQNPIWVFKASLNGFPTDFLGHHSPLHVPSLWSIRSTWHPRGHLPRPLSHYSLCLEFPLTSFCLAKSADASNSGSNVTSSWELPHWNKLISLHDAESHSFCYPCETAYSWRAESFLKFAIHLQGQYLTHGLGVVLNGIEFYFKRVIKELELPSYQETKLHMWPNKGKVILNVLISKTDEIIIMYTLEKNSSFAGSIFLKLINIRLHLS